MKYFPHANRASASRITWSPQCMDPTVHSLLRIRFLLSQVSWHPGAQSSDLG